MRTRFDPRAEEELTEAALYYEDQVEGLGERFIDAVEVTLRRIERSPHIHPRLGNGCSKCRVPRFPYGIIFRECFGVLQIIAVMHLKRRPGYWQERL